MSKRILDEIKSLLDDRLGSLNNKVDELKNEVERLKANEANPSVDEEEENHSTIPPFLISEQVPIPVRYSGEDPNYSLENFKFSAGMWLENRPSSTLARDVDI